MLVLETVVAVDMMWAMNDELWTWGERKGVEVKQRKREIHGPLFFLYEARAQVFKSFGQPSR